MTHSHAAPGGHPLLLLGMHRSGTSLIARVLAECRARLGHEDELLPAHPVDNPRGYNERLDVLRAHDRFLEAIGCAWDRVSTLPSLPGVGAADLKLRQDLRASISAIQGPGPWLIKDPRLCLLLPFWQEMLPHAVSIVVVRHPLEIAASLFSSHRGVYPTMFSVALWQKYLTCALAGLKGREAVFVDYRSFLTDPSEQISRLVGALKTLGVSGLERPTQTRIDELLDPKLHRHQVSESEESHLDSRQRELFEWLRQAAMAQGAVQIDTSLRFGHDSLLGEFELAFESRIRSSAESERKIQIESRRELVESHSRLQGLLETMQSEHGARLRELTVEHRRLRDDNVRREREIRAATIDASLLRAELNRTRAHATALEAHADNLDRSIVELKSSWSWRIGAPIRLLGKMRLLPGRSERWLYRLYYRFPGLSPARKRALIEWLHRNVPWLTRNTVSYQLYQAARALPTAHGPGGWLDELGEEQASQILAGLKRRPLISILMPVFNTDPAWLEAAVESVRAQRYPDWQLCIADDASDRQETIAWLRNLDDSRIKVIRLVANAGIAMASNEALAVAEGDYIALLDHDDVLAVDALLEVACRLDESDADFVYTDEDKIDFDGRHVEPHFKPDFSPDYFHSSNYLCHLSVIRRRIVTEAGGFRKGFDGAQDFDLFLRCTELAQSIEHIPKVLYHWRKHAGSTSAASEAKPKSWEAGRRALQQSLERREIHAVVDLGGYPNTYRVRYRIHAEPLVSVVIPFRDQPELLASCVDSVLDKGGYRNVEVLAVDNGSVDPRTQELLERLKRRDARVRVLRHDVPFNYSAINNWAVHQARGEQLLLLNNDIEAKSDRWIVAMLEHAQRKEVGIVGARLLYPDDTVQHAGVIIGLGGVAGHSHLFQPAQHPGYFARAHLIQNLSAVTFACAMLRKQVFEELGGLNESDLAIAFNDVDLCLRARERGYLIVYTPYAELYHHESKSRGAEDTPEKLKRFNQEIAYMQRRHGAALRRGDPYYSPNLSLHAHRSFEIDVKRC